MKLAANVGILSSLLSTAAATPAYSLELEVDATGAFTLFVAAEDGARESWSQSAGEPRLHAEGRWLDLNLTQFKVDSAPHRSSKVFTYTDVTSGQDMLSVNFTTFPHDPAFVVVEQCVLTDLKHTAVDASVALAKEKLMAAAPRFTVEAPEAPAQRGFFAYYDQMVGGMENGTKHGRWGVDGIPSGTMAGPIVVFNPDRAGAIAISSASSFMSQSGCHDRAAEALEFGLMGSITEVPKGTCWSVAVSSGTTPTEAVNTLGSRLLERHGKRPFASRDVSLDKLSYSTDNGAFYYYNSFPFSSPQEALENVLLKSEPAVPVGSILLDSWWYPKGPGGGVTNWTATDAAFPDGGLPEFQRRTGLPIVAHNRYWSSETTYARANGGDYEFLIEPLQGKAIPLEQRFWDDLLLNASKDWGLAVYEQDWLHNEWEGLHATLQSASLAETWLQQMGRGASRAGVTIQYCMAYPRHALASVAIPAVNQIRVSDDYAVDLKQSRPNANLYVGTSSLLAAALGLAPSKDVFWSTTMQPGNEGKYKNATEPHPELEAMVSILTAGPVAVGDRYNYTNVSLVNMITTADGTLLKPSWPAVPVDEYHTQRALGSGGPDGELTYTSSAVESDRGIRKLWIHVLAIDLKSSYTFDMLKSLPEMLSGTRSLAVVRPPLTLTSKVQLVHSQVHIPACGKSDYQHVVVTEVAEDNCFTFFGEVNKLVPVSPARFTKIESCPSAGSSEARLRVEAVGSPGERIEVLYAQMAGKDYKLFTAHCVIGGADKRCEIAHEAHDGLVI